jgi:hypothetical protein
MIRASVSPVTQRVRAYFAPVNRTTGSPELFDPAQAGGFALDSPPAPWVDLGYISEFVRTSATKYQPLLAGAPSAPVAQVRSEIGASVSFAFDAWGKLQAALASGSQQSNLLVTAGSVAPNGSGGLADIPVPLLTSPPSTASMLNVGTVAAAQFAPGTLVAVDADYTGQTGYVGAGISAAYVRSAASVAADSNYVRRVTLNVGVVESIAGGVLQLASPLPAGTPIPDMQVSRLVGFCDREGASFFHEWSALFVLEGTQGERILFHYPRLQPMQASAERSEPLIASGSLPLGRIRLACAFRALPVRDASDAESVVCFRSYLPAPMSAV